MLNIKNQDSKYHVQEQYSYEILSGKGLLSTNCILDLLDNHKKLKNDYEGISLKYKLQKEENLLLKDKIAELEKRSKKPKFKEGDNKLDKEDEDKSNRSNDKDARGKICSDAEIANSQKKQRGKYGSKKLQIDEVKIIQPECIPVGAKLKCYKKYTVQDITLSPKNILIKRAVYQLTDGTLIMGELPKEYQGNHFGVNLRNFIIYQYHKMRSTEGIIHEGLKDIGIKISKTQIRNIIHEGSLMLEEEYESILDAGLQYSEYIQVDDTVGKHGNKHHYVTQIGNEAFSFFKSSYQKNRVNFLEILNNGNIEYCFTDESIKYLEKYKIEIYQCLVLRTTQNLFSIFTPPRYFLYSLESLALCRVF